MREREREKAFPFDFTSILVYRIVLSIDRKKEIKFLFNYGNKICSLIIMQ